MDPNDDYDDFKDVYDEEVPHNLNEERKDYVVDDHMSEATYKNSVAADFVAPALNGVEALGLTTTPNMQLFVDQIASGKWTKIRPSS